MKEKNSTYHSDFISILIMIDNLRDIFLKFIFLLFVQHFSEEYNELCTEEY